MMEGRSRGYRATIMALAVAIALLGADIAYQGFRFFQHRSRTARHNRAVALANRGVALMFLGQWGPALDSLNAAQTLAPYDRAIKFNLSLAYGRSLRYHLDHGDYHGAITDGRRARELGRANPSILLNNADAFARTGQVDSAIAILEQAAAGSPGSPIIKMRLHMMREVKKASHRPAS